MGINLRNRKAIAKWREKYELSREDGRFHPRSLTEIMDDSRTRAEVEEDERGKIRAMVEARYPALAKDDVQLFTVQNFFYAEKSGKILIEVERNFQARSAEEALLLYLHEPAERSAGRGKDYVSFKLYGRLPLTDFQEIRVMPWEACVSEENGLAEPEFEDDDLVEHNPEKDHLGDYDLSEGYTV